MRPIEPTLACDAPDAAPAIARWTAEFVDPSLERAFRDRHERSTLQAAVIAVLIGGFFNLAFGYNDYLVLGASPTLWVLLSARVAVAIAALIGAAVMRARPREASDGGPVTALEVLLLVNFLMVVVLRPGGLQWHMLIMSVIVLALYLFVPNRFHYASAVSLIGSLAFLLTLASLGAPTLDLTRSFLLLGLANTVGLLTAYRFNRLRRMEFALLTAAEAANARLSQEVAERSRLEEELKRVARTDALTGLYNRRHFMELAQQELRHAVRRGAPLALCLLDVDNFKQINDSFGHAVGDEALRKVAEICRGSLRAVDIIGRFGGEEFTLALPDSTLEGAAQVAERLREELAAAEIPTPRGPLRLTATIGIAGCGSEGLEQALHRADMALYEGKRTGRNRVVVGG